MKYTIICLLFTLILINGCTKDNPPTQVHDISKNEIVNSIIGQWKCGSSWNFTFYSDTTFIDSISFAVYSPDGPKYELFYVVKGTYSIKNDLLTFPQMELVFADTTHLLPFNDMENYIFYPSKVKFEGEELLLNIEDILSPINGEGKQLDGSWRTENWIVQVERRPTQMAFLGKIYKEFQFNEDSLKYHFKLTNSFGSPYLIQSDSGSFIYSKDILSFGSHITIPTFSNGQLLLNYVSWPVFSYKKVK